MPDWFSAALQNKSLIKQDVSCIDLFRLPPLHLDDKILSDSQRETLLKLLKYELKKEPELSRRVRESLRPDELDDFSWGICSQWLNAGANSTNKWCMQCLGLLGGDACALKLTPLIRKWPGESQHARAVLGLEVLANIGSDTALMQLNGIAQKLKFQGLKKKAREKMQELAKARGMTQAELEDRIIPDCGLDSSGRKMLDFGPRQFEFVLTPELKAAVKDEKGKVRTNLPKPNQKDNQAIAEQTVAEWKVLKKQIKEVATIQSSRLEQAMCTGRRWPVADFRRFLLEHPLMFHLARLLLWGEFDATGNLVGAFRVDDDRSLANSDDEQYALDSNNNVGVVHPLELGEAQIRSWGETFTDYEIMPPFEQLSRATYDLSAQPKVDENITLLDGKKFPAISLVGLLDRLNWMRGIPEDAGIFYQHSKIFFQANVTCVIQYEGVPIGYMDGWDDQPVNYCYFIPGKIMPEMYPDHKNCLKLKDIPPIVISEVMRDLMKIGEKAI